MHEIEKLIEGYKQFFHRYFVEGDETYQRLAREGQSPRIAMIACSDSRVDPSIITDAGLGELFVIRNVANLIPPYQPDDSSYHGTSAALEFAVNTLEVRHVVVFGHSKCAGIRALIEDKYPEKGGQSFIRSWMQIASKVREDVVCNHGHLPFDQQSRLCERKAVEQSLKNLATFPWISDKLLVGKLYLHGWHLDLDEGKLYCYSHKEHVWNPIS